MLGMANVKSAPEATIIMHVGFLFIFVMWVHFSRQPQVSSFSLKTGCSQSTSPHGSFLLLLSIRHTNRTMGWSMRWWDCGPHKEHLSALCWWMTSGREMVILVSQFEASMTTDWEVVVQGVDHHEVQRSFQVSFFKGVKSLVTTIEDSGNLFLEESDDLIILDTKEIAGPAAVTILLQIEAVGKEQCNQFITEHLLNRTKSLYDQEKQSQFVHWQFFSTKKVM